MLGAGVRFFGAGVSLLLRRFGQIVDDDAVQVLVALTSVGVLFGVQGGGAPEPLPRLVLPAVVKQCVRVGLEQPGRPGPRPGVGELGHPQDGRPGRRAPLIPAYPRFDDEQFDPRRPVEVGDAGVVDDG